MYAYRSSLHLLNRGPTLSPLKEEIIEHVVFFHFLKLQPELNVDILTEILVHNADEMSLVIIVEFEEWRIS